MTKKTKTNETPNEATEMIMPVSSMSQDLKTAVLIVSVVANLFIFTAWIALQVTTQYDAQVASFLFNR
ncbi:MAG TPA: hypothetical protein VLG71_03480 [Candidatus Limnocylindria bacterium]|nr:hypothetical protein [Candidatus Limnocylindria bacterium]